MVKISAIRDNGVHVSTHTMTLDKFKRLAKDPAGFWLFQTSPF